MIGSCPHPLLAALDSCGTPAFPIELARTLREATGADAIAITEFGFRPSWAATLVEISRDPLLLGTERLQLSLLAEPVFAPGDSDRAIWSRERELADPKDPGAERRQVLHAVNTTLTSGPAGCVVATIVHVLTVGTAAIQSRARLDTLTPVLGTLWQMHLRAVNLTTERDALFEALGQRGVGAITLDRRGAPISVNRRAAEMMGASGLLALSPARLTATSATDATRLREALARAIADLDQGKRPGPQSLTLVGEAGDSEARGAALGLQVHAIATGLPQEGARAPAVVVLLQDLHRDIRPDVRANASRFALTPVEIELACHLADGRQLDAAAKHQRISIHTARKYLQQIFAKTGASRQAELVRLLVSGTIARPGAAPARMPLRRIAAGALAGPFPVQRSSVG
ncbi:MAG: helix-turn-helix transcriptional regulator [Alphaproteobacteria bacterium]|nr:helix-turn-helix transcriptional regulator [Alphaproteobacteria bacterium]